MKNWKTAVFICVLLPFLFACQPSKDRAQILAEVEQAIITQNYTEAEIKLKSLLNENAEDSQVRRMLGSLLLERGNFSGAAKELRRAISLGIEEPKVQVE